MSWLIDNAGTFYLLLGITAAGLVIAWQVNQRAKFLGYAAGILVLIGIIWLLTQFAPRTDRQQLEANVDAMARAVVDGKTDDLFKHISPQFNYKQMTRDILHKKARAAVKVYNVTDVRITKFNVDELSREKKFAKTSFRVSAWYAGNEQPYLFGTEADFVLEGDQWMLKTMRFYNPLVNQNQEMDLPFP